MNEVVITGSKIVIRAKRLSDAQNDYNWESDPQLADLDAVHPLKISFHRYVNDYSYELKIPFQNSRHFAIDTMDGKHIGNCSYYHISEQDGEAEFGIMIGNRDYWDKGYGEDATRTLVDYIFRTTSLKRIYLKTLESNDRALKCFNKCGFVWCGRLLNEGFNFVVMEILRKQWEAKSPV